MRIMGGFFFFFALLLCMFGNILMQIYNEKMKIPVSYILLSSEKKWLKQALFKNVMLISLIV